jgi:hypothetical protein
MTTIYSSTEGVSPYEERVAVTATVTLEMPDQRAAERFPQLILDGVEPMKSQGPLRIDVDQGATARQLIVKLEGSLASMMLLDHEHQNGQRVFDARAPMSAVMTLHLQDRAFADSISSYVMAIANGHPASDRPLRIESDYNDSSHDLKLTLSGSVFGVSYILTVVYARLTQRLKRDTRYV